VIEFDPNNRFALVKKGLLLLDEKRYEEALESLNRALIVKPDDYDTLLNKKKALKELGRNEELIRTADELIFMKDRPEEWLDKALALRDLGNHTMAINAIDTALATDPNNFTFLSEKKKIQIVMRDYKNAIETCEIILSIDQNNKDALYDKALALQQLGDFREAVETYDRALEVDPMDRKGWNSKGALQMRLKDYEGAIESFEKTLDADPGNKFAIIKKGDALLALEKFEDAIGVYDNLLAIDGNNIEAMNSKAMTLSKLEKHDEALRVIDAAIAKDPDNLQTLKQKGMVLLNMKRFDEAISYFDRLLEKGESKEILSGKGEALESLDKWNEALDCYSRALEMDSNDAQLWYRRGLLHSKLGQFREAVDAYDWVLGIDDTDKFAWQMRALAFQQLGNNDEALISYDYAVGLDSQDKALWSNKGLVLLDLNRPQDAIRCFEKALELDPKFESALKGKEIADERIKERSLEEYAVKVLEFECLHNRPVTKEEAFKECGVPFNYLDDLFRSLSKRESIDLDSLSEQESRELENASMEVIRSIGDIGDGIRLCDIMHNLSHYDLQKAKRVLSYIEKVETTPITYTPDPEVDNLIRMAINIPRDQRNVVDLVKHLNIGVRRARMVEVALRSFTGETADSRVRTPTLMGKDFYRELLETSRQKTEAKLEEDAGLHRCKQHDSEAYMQHYCGQWLCKTCTKGVTKCPICHYPLKIEKPEDMEKEGPVKEVVLKPVAEEKEPRKDEDEFMRL
jgi:superkiller protein 3